MKLLADLISIPSVSGKEEMIQKYIVRYLERVGLMSERVGENVVVKLTGQDSSRALVFNAHVDTVAAGDQQRWQTDPWVPVKKAGKMYGLGASDEKVGVASLLRLAKRLIDDPPEVDVWLMFVVREELDGAGTKECVEWWQSRGVGEGYEQVAAVLVEPTGLEAVEIGHRGNVFVELAVEGSGGHGSRPDKVAVNPVVVGQVLQRVSQLHTKWQVEYRDKWLGRPSIGVGIAIKGGDLAVPNKFADRCRASLDVRTIPVMHETALAELKRWLADYPVTVTVLGLPAPAGLVAEDAVIVRVVRQVVSEVKVTVSAGSTDQCFFTAAGIPAVIFGPGEKSVIHQPNEYCYLDKLIQSGEIYWQIIKCFSGQGGSAITGRDRVK